MAFYRAAIASRAPPRPPNVLAGPRRDCDPAESSSRHRRGTAGAPIDAAMAHRQTLPRCDVRPRRAAAPRGDGGRASERGRARVSRDVSRGFPSARSLTGGPGPGEVDTGDDERRAAMTRAFRKPHAGATRESARGRRPRPPERSRGPPGRSY